MPMAPETRPGLKIVYADVGIMAAPFEEDGWQNLGQLDLPAGQPLDFTVTPALGFEGEEGTDNFSVYVVVADREQRKRVPPEQRHHALYFHEFDWPKIRKAIEQRAYACERGTFAQSLVELRRVFLWEFRGNGAGAVAARRAP